MKKFLMGAFAALAAFAFVACDDSNDDEEPAVAKVTFTPAAGEVAANTEITLATTTEEAVIYYAFVKEADMATAADVELSAVYDPANKPKITEAGMLMAIAVKGEDASEPATAVYTIAAPALKPGNPYSTDALDGSVLSPGKSKIHYFSDVEGVGEQKGTVYYQFVAEGGQPTLTASNYAEDGVATKYESSFYFTEAGTYYCIAVYEGAVSDIVSFTYTATPNRAAGLAAAEKKIAAMTHVTANLPVDDIKDGLKDGVTTYIVSDAEGLDILAEIVNGKPAVMDNSDPDNPIVVTPAVDPNTLSGYTFTQTADISFNDTTVLTDAFEAPAEASRGVANASLTVFSGIGAKGKQFAGTYDGNGYKISHMYIYAGHNVLGFVCESAATTVLKNIILEDACVVASCVDGDSDDRVGGFIGKVGAAGTTIENCVFMGAVGSAEACAPTDTKAEYYGGFIGDCNKVAVTISDSISVARITCEQDGDPICIKNIGSLTMTNVQKYDASIDE